MVTKLAPTSKRSSPARPDVSIRPQCDAVGQSATPMPLSFGRAEQLVHALMFMNEFTRAIPQQDQRKLEPLVFFLHRAGGLQVLTLLLNAAYHKPPAGRVSGWPFGVLRSRVDVSERTLRQLLADAVKNGFVSKVAFEVDRRYSVYSATTSVIDAWEDMFRRMAACVPDVLATYTPGMLANVDYGRWTFASPAEHQQPSSPVLSHLKSSARRRAAPRSRRGRSADQP